MYLLGKVTLNIVQYRVKAILDLYFSQACILVNLILHGYFTNAFYPYLNPKMKVMETLIDMWLDIYQNFLEKLIFN